MERFTQGLKDPINGGAQLLTNLLPKGVVDAGNSANNWLADKTGLVGRLPEGGVDQQVRQQEVQYQARRGDTGLDGYRLLGNVASPANVAVASRLPQAASLAGRVGVSAGGGALSGLLNPVTEGDFNSEKSKQVGLGAVFGGAIPAVTGGLARVVSPNASTNPNLALLKAEGVKPTVGQSLGGWANSLEEKAKIFPVVGDMISRARSNANDQFNNAAINRATAPLGVKIQGSGQKAINEASDLVSQAYNASDALLGGFKVDQTAQSELARLAKMAAVLPKNEQKVFNNNLQNIQSSLSPNGSLLADSYGTLKSKIGKDAADFMGSNDAYQKKLGNALTEMQSILVNNAKRANPEAGALRDKADEAFANLVRVQGASVGGKLKEGVFTPGQLLTAVRGADKSVRDNATARGTALMQDLGNAGQSVLGNVVPSSGTAERMMLGGTALGGAYALNPAIPASLLGGAAMYTSPMQSLLRGAVSSRPNFAKPTAQSIRDIAPYFIPAGAQFGNGLLD
jgi:F0F1-type ATP synthase membrane subunit b/b'